MNQPLTRDYMRNEIERLAGLVLECKIGDRRTDMTQQEIFFLSDVFGRVRKITDKIGRY